MGNKIAASLLTVVLLLYLTPGTQAQSNEGKELPLKESPTGLSGSRDSVNTDYPYEKPEVYNDNLNYWILGAFGSVYTAAFISVHIAQANAWWQDQRGSFHFQNDWTYSRWIDKAGHLYAGYALQHFASMALEGANMTSEASTLWGAAAALGFQTYVEIEDGFATDWGFSPGDAYANLIGSLYPVLQYYVPYFKNFMFKASYWPAHLDDPGLITGQQHIFADDYEGQKFWLSFRMKQLLPDAIAEYWPEPLMLSVGYGVRDLTGDGGGKSDFYIALDIDAETIPLYGKFWQAVKNTLNYLHLPMPGIRVNNGTAFFVLLY